MHNTNNKCRLAVCAAMTVLLFSAQAFAADVNKPHTHQGKVPAYIGAPPFVKLDAKDQAQLEKGKHIMKQIHNADGKGGGGIAVFRVGAPADVVWQVISDFNKYPKWIKSLSTTEIYRQTGNNLWVRFIIDTPFKDYEYFVKHDYRPSEGWGTWTLDYSRLSDLDDSVGYWRVYEAPGHPGMSQIEYSVNLSLGWVPGFIKNLIVDKGLEEATVWVRVQSEKRQKENLASSGGSAPQGTVPAQANK